MSGHRVLWFPPDRPVEGNTVYVRQGVCPVPSRWVLDELARECIERDRCTCMGVEHADQFDMPYVEHTAECPAAVVTRIEPWRGPAVNAPFECPRCLPDEFGERIDIHTFGQLPCVHVGGEWETPPPGAWRAGDMHECPMFLHVHPAGSDCVVYAVRHGDRLYRPDAS